LSSDHGQFSAGDYYRKIQTCTAGLFKSIVVVVVVNVVRQVDVFILVVCVCTLAKNYVK
jgi:hypothetical protein